MWKLRDIFNGAWFRFWHCLAVMSLIAVLITSSLLAIRERALYLSELEERAAAEAGLIGNILAKGMADAESADFRGFCADAAIRNNNRITVITSGGRVLVETELAPAQMESHHDRPEIMDALRLGVGVSRRHSATLGMEMVYFAHACATPAGEILVVRISQPAPEAARIISANLSRALTPALAALAVAWILAFWLSRRFSNPLRELATWAGNAAEGDCGDPPDMPISELSQLAMAFGKNLAKMRDAIGGQEGLLDELRSSVSLYRETIASISDSVFMSDIDGNLTFICPNAERNFGYNVEELRSMGTIHRVFDRVVFEPGEIPAVNDEIVNRELDIVHKNCERRNLLVNIKRINHSGSAFLFCCRDVSERMRMLDELKRINAELMAEAKLAQEMAAKAAAASSSKSMFMSHVSHEIRTPMTGVIGIGELLLADDTLPSEHRELVEMMHYSGRQMVSIINDVLDFAKIEAGKFELCVRGFDINDVIDGVFRPLSIGAHKSGLKIEVSRSPNIPKRLWGDAVRLGQILTNLGTNAIKFTKIGGVNVSVEPIEDDGDYCLLEFRVSDTGEGIPAATLEKLFSPFTQADARVATEHGGTGLGLAICKSLVSAMDGGIKVESVEGKGSTFIFTARFAKKGTDSQWSSTAVAKLAADPDTDPSLVAAAKSGLKPGGGSRDTLIVDGNHVNRIYLAKLLGKMGLSHDFAGNGGEAVEMLSRHDFRIVFMDVQMPGMDGHAAVRVIRDPGTSGIRDRDIPIIGLSASIDPGDRRRCLDSGMNEYLVKPVTAAEIRRIVGKWLPILASASPEPISAAEGDDDAPQIWNRQKLARNLGVADGDDEIIESMVDEVRESVRHLVGELETAVGADDPQAVLKSAHSLKGIAATFCLEKLSAAVTVCACAAKNGKRDAVRNSLEQVTAAAREFQNSPQ